MNEEDFLNKRNDESTGVEVAKFIVYSEKS